MSAAKLLVGKHGGVAVVERDETDNQHRIRAWDARGVTVVTDIPPDVQLESVRIAGNLLRWKQNGVERSFGMSGARASPRAWWPYALMIVLVGSAGLLAVREWRRHTNRREGHRSKTAG